MNYKKPDSYEQSLNRALKPESQNDDVIIQAVENDEGVEEQLYKKTNDIVFQQDPDSGKSFPITVSKIVKKLDSNGIAFGSASQVVYTKCKCFVNSASVVECRKCHRKVCKLHSFRIKEEVYWCRKFPCNLTGRLYQIFGFFYRVLRFCFRSVTGLE